MTGSRIIWRRAHPVRLPDRTYTDPHLELYEAYRQDRLNAELSEQIAAELEREFRVELR